YKVGDWYAYRLVVKDGNYEVYINGRKIHEDRLPEQYDPWLAVQVGAALTGGARNLKISGTPTIPEVVSLSNRPDLSGWLANYYGEVVEWGNAGLFRNRGEQNSGASWTKRGEEILGRVFNNAPGSKQESILRFHRPLLEDGELEYEFFY